MAAPARTPDSAPIFAFVSALLILSAHIVAKATRDALFLSEFDVTLLPRAMIVAAAASLAVTMGFARLLARWAPHRLVPSVFLASAALFFAEWWLLDRAPRVVAVLVYLHFSGLGAVLVSGFWSVVNERFDPYTGKTVVARAGGWAALGGVVGGVLAERLSTWLGLPALLLTLTMLHGVAALVVNRIGAGGVRPAEEETPGGALAGLRIVRRTPLLRQMALFVVLIAVMESAVDYVLKAEAAARYPDREALVRFFSIFYTGVGVGAFVLQSTIGPVVLRRLGLSGSMATLPIGVLLTSIAGALVTRLATAAAAAGSASVLMGSFFRAGFELLYTPLDPATKRPAKAFVDVGGQRVGEMIVGGLIVVVLALFPAMPQSGFLWMAAAAALVCLALLVGIHRGYVAALGRSLRTGVLTLEAEELHDAVTERTYADNVSIDRAELAARIREIERREGRGAEAEDGATLDAVVERARRLASGADEEVRATLAEGVDARLIAWVVPLLERFALLEDAEAWLAEIAPAHVGQLADALLDARSPTMVRRHLPRVLGQVGDRRAVVACLEGLGDDDFDVRVACARAAFECIARRPELRQPAEPVCEAVQRELAVDPRTWEHRARTRSVEDSGTGPVARGLPRRVPRNVEHVFCVLGLAFDGELIASSLGGLYSDDPGLRGTAHEYLEAALPAPLWRELRPRLPAAGPHARHGRRIQDITEELRRAGRES